MTQTKESQYYPKVAPWDEPPSGGIIIHGKKTPDHEVIIAGFDPDTDEKTESADRYQIRVAMPKSSLETRGITVTIKNTKTGQLEFEPLELHLGIPGDPINLIIMDVVMKNGNTITQPETNPSGQKPWVKDLGKNNALTITVRDGASPDVVLSMKRIPNANGQKPVKFEVESNVPFDPKRGHENIDYHYIENSSRHIAVIARWDDTKDDCIIWVYTDNAATVTFT